MAETTERSLLERPIARRTLLAAFGAGVLSATACGGESDPRPIDDCGDMLPQAEHREVNQNPANLIDYNWHTPGIERDRNGNLLVTQTNAEAVPMNMYGARLDTSGDFAVGARAQLQGEAAFVLHVKDGLALSFDGYVQSPGGVRVSVGRTRGTVDVWRNEHDAPIKRTFNLQRNTIDKQVVIERRGGLMAIFIGDEQIGAFDNVLDSGHVWFGLASKGGESTVDEITARELPGGSINVVDTSTLEYPQCTDGLAAKVAAKTNGRLAMGTATKLAPFVENKRYGSLLIGEFQSITTENAGKFRFLQPERGRYTFGELDALLDIAKRHDKDVWLHTLVWHRELPAWVLETPAAQREKIMTDHITKVMERTKGRISGVDVVNEPLEEYSGNLRQTPWKEAMGPDYIAKAFEAAHAANPNVELWLNEYGWDKPNQKDEDRFQALLAIAKNLKARGIRIDGVGLQAHVLQSPRDSANIAVLRQRMQAFAAIGIKVRISEIDITENAGKASQAKQYSDMLHLAIDQPNCTGYTMWGIGGPYVSTADVRKPSIEMRTPWDERLQPTSIYKALQEAAA